MESIINRLKQVDERIEGKISEILHPNISKENKINKHDHKVKTLQDEKPILRIHRV